MSAPVEAEAFLFDLDGTLINSHAVVDRVWRHWALEHRLDPDEVVRGCQGRRSLDTQIHFAPHLPQPESNQILIDRECADTDGLVAIEGAREFLTALPRNRWAIVTSCSAQLARVRMGALQIPVPDILIVGDDVGRGKPDPQGYLLAAQKLGFAADRCVVFEDAPAGVEAGNRAGMQVITVTATHSHPTKSPKHIANFLELKILQTSPLVIGKKS